MKKKMDAFLVYTWSILAAICLLTILFVVVGNACRIRDTMIGELEQVYAKKYDEIRDISDSDETDKNVLLGKYQLALSESETVTYPYYSSGILQYRNGEVAARSQNMMICTFSATDKQGNLTTRTVPMGFTWENDADVAYLLFDHAMRLDESDLGVLRFYGYWDGDIFYIYEFTDGYVSYQALENMPTDAEKEHFGVGTLYEYSRLRTVKCVKSYGGDSENYLKASDGWEKTDKLTEELIEMELPESAGEYYQVQKDSIYRTLVIGIRYLNDKHGVFKENLSVKLVWGAEFSPLGLAISEMMKNGTIIFVLLFFVFGGVILTSMYRTSIREQMWKYQDEIHRQQQALTYAQDAENSRREMTSAIAHELKTPIAVLSSYAEALQENIDAEKQSRYLGVIREETEKMDRMVLELLDLSRLEAGKYKLQRENFDLSELVQEILTPLEPQLQEKNIILDKQVGEVLINADRYRFGQVVENYMTNAIRHTPEGGKIVLRIGMNRETFSVENQGQPLSQEQLTKVWDTFWQGDQSRNQRGSGLGLSIVKTIMQLHGGSCRAENTASGVRFIADLRGEKTQVILRSMPKEDFIEIEYPIAQEQTTVKLMFSQLGLLDGRRLHRELKAGNIKCGNLTVVSGKAKVMPGNVVSWREYRITVVLDNDTKRRALIANQFQVTGRLNNFAPHVGANSGMK